MTSTTTKSAFVEGFLNGLPFLLVLAPFSILFGVIATSAGLDLFQTMGFSVLVIAGASQFTAVQLMSHDAPIWVVCAAALAVNLRMAMYSASLQPYLGSAPLWQRALVGYLNVDQSYAASVARYETEPDMSVPARVAFFLGTMVHMAPAWYAFTMVGAVAGSVIPKNLPLDFALPILFLALVAPMVKTLAHLAAAITSVVAALSLSFLPSGIAVLLSGLLAMAAGAEVERRRGRR